MQVNPTETYKKVEVTNADWQTHSIQFTVQEGKEEVALAVYRWPKKVVSFDDLSISWVFGLATPKDNKGSEKDLALGVPDQ